MTPITEIIPQRQINSLMLAGFAVVPIEPTNKMLKAAKAAMSPEKGPVEWVSVKEKHAIRYRAMVKEFLGEIT